MKFEDLFENTDDITADKIADKYPVLTDEDKERLFAMSKRKYNTNNTEFKGDNEVFKVEKYSRPKWYKALSIAAAAVLVIGGIGGAAAVIKMNSHAPRVESSNVEIKEPETEITTEVHTESLMSEEEYMAIAKELTDNFLEMANVIQHSGVSIDENDRLSYYVYDSENQEWFDSYAFYRDYYRVTDERFKNTDDLYEYFYKNVSSGFLEHTNEYDTEYDLTRYIGGDASKYPTGSSIDIAELVNSDSEDIGMFYSNYITYNGELYTANDFSDQKLAFSSEPKVYDLAKNSFTVSRFVLPSNAKENYKYGEEKIYTVVLEDGNWKIDSIDTGMMPEYEAFIAIQCYLETYDEYNDIDINEINATITDFDEESGTFRAEAVIKDVAGNDAIKVIADVSNYSAIDASVTRLREKDETLKRPDVLWRENYLDKMARAVIKYIEENEEYKNMNLDLDIKHVYTKVYDYDDATGTCSGHATIQRTDGNDALDWYIGVDLNTETVTSCQNHEEYLQNSAF